MLIKDSKILVTGGAGFIGSNLIDELLKQGNFVRCLDNFATGKKENIEPFLSHENFEFIEGDIRDLEACKIATEGIEYVLHQAALGSVPRSINDPITSNEVNISGFLNMLVASRDANVKRFVYAASSSTYGDHPDLPKVEDNIGKPLSPYAVTKYVNELYAKVFADTYGLETIGLRYFNVFGRKQDPYGAYAAVIPKFVSALMRKEAPVINGDGTHSRDFTYIDNVIHANQVAALSTHPDAINTVYNVAFGENTSLNQLFDTLVEELSVFDSDIKNIKPVYGPERAGDVKHSLASIDKAATLLGYNPKFSFKEGIKDSVRWYWENLVVNS
ncbi:SDR family oxidoreductase [Sediminitomix flava]|uniref:UDP-N-acetylglucosamine 4-epimerase n=1 Tax=Sediminitomix flava TaxID=379075 RepID=A0A315YWL7_SEDFL|nr:SDR family oxidoreductase [Sediminitomix flava]PWJ34164.1 UDP-N-acetylglucosamine 4-epimerase [Sediminitomix flava]